MHPAALNKLGCDYFAKQQWQEAADAFQQALLLRADYLDAYYNLGLAFNKLKRSEEAMNAWGALLALSPDHLGAGFQMGCLLMRQGSYQQAYDRFVVILKNYPTHVESLANVATCCLQLGKLIEAEAYYLRVLEQIGEDAQTLYNLGVLQVQQRKPKKAVDYYLRALAVEPDFFEAHNNLGAIYLGLKNREAAAVHFKEALRIQPGNEAVRHTLAILSQQEGITVTPQVYISALFDSYADHYDVHLSQSLQYQVPAQMYDMMYHTVSIPDHQWRVLDLGCGTGLCGQFFRGAASVLTGVDLSERMLTVAREKQLYDQLVQQEALAFLQQAHRAYDLIVAGDVLVYMGDLSAIVAAARRALREGGYLLFNVEASGTEGFYLGQSGRFVHHKEYLEQLITAQSFNILSFRAITLRMQDERPVQGYLYLLQAM